MSSRLKVLHGRGVSAPDVEASVVREATIATTPAVLTDDVYVLVHDFDDSRRIGPVLGWRTAPEATWPVRGDLALIVEVQQGNTWLLAWEPTS